MNMINVICCICIFIEFYHLMCHDRVKPLNDKYIKINTIYKAFNGVHDNLETFINAYTDNPLLREFLPKDTGEHLTNMYNELQGIGTKDGFKRTVTILNLKEMKTFVLFQLIEAVYYILEITLVCILPSPTRYVVAIILILLTIVSRIMDRINIKYWYIVDCMLCMLTFVLIYR